MKSFITMILGYDPTASPHLDDDQHARARLLDQERRMEALFRSQEVITGHLRHDDTAWTEGQDHAAD